MSWKQYGLRLKVVKMRIYCILKSLKLIIDAYKEGIPMVDRVDPGFYQVVQDGDQIVVDADTSTIEILN